MDSLGTRVGEQKAVSAHLRFLKDVLYGLHVFAIQDLCSSLHETLQKKTFSHTSQTPGLRSEKRIPEPSKRHPKTLHWRFRRQPEAASKLGAKKSDFLRWNLPRGFGVFEPWTLEKAPQLYIYIYIRRPLKGVRKAWVSVVSPSWFLPQTRKTEMKPPPLPGHFCPGSFEATIIPRRRIRIANL